MTRILLLPLLLLAAGSAHAASFDCKKARTSVEKQICASPTLSRLDDALEQNFGGSMATDIGDEERLHLQRTQRAWLKERNRCKTAQCIEQSYRKRIDALCDYPALTGVNWGCAVNSEDIK